MTSNHNYVYNTIILLTKKNIIKITWTMKKKKN